MPLSDNNVQRPPQARAKVKKAYSAYVHWSLANREKVKQGLPPKAKLLDALQASWAELSAEEQKPWHKKALLDRKRYDREMKAANRGKISANSSATAPAPKTKRKRVHKTDEGHKATKSKKSKPSQKLSTTKSRSAQAKSVIKSKAKASAAVSKSKAKPNVAAGIDEEEEEEEEDMALPTDDVQYNPLSDDDETEHMDECIECGDGGTLLCCEGCPRVCHASCLELRSAPKEWWCPTCCKAALKEHTFTKGQYRVDGPYVREVERLCAMFPPSHFLSVRASQLRTIRQLTRKCMEVGVQLEGLRHIAPESAVIRQLRQLLPKKFHPKARRAQKRGDKAGNGASDNTTHGAGANADADEDASTSDEEFAVDECVACGNGGVLICCDGCSRAYHARCTTMTALPGRGGRTEMRCPTCIRASVAKMKYAKGRYVADGPHVRAVEKLCAKFPPSHFLSVRASQLCTIRKLLSTCKSMGVDVHALHNVSSETAAIRQLRSALAGRKGGTTSRTLGGLDASRGHVSARSSQIAITALGDMPAAPSFAPAPLNVLKEQFERHGYALHGSALDQVQVQAVADKLDEFFRQVIYTVNTLQLTDTLHDRGFKTFKLRQHGRYDFVDPMLAPRSYSRDFAFMHEGASWLPLVRALLGDDAVCIHSGCMLSMPGSVVQNWHSDGDHESTSVHLPPHCINVFFPLVPITALNGGTELVPTSHIFGNYGTATDSVTPMPAPGQALLFDYRIKHRGLGNRSSEPRPVVYFTYAQAGFAKKAVADANYTARQYEKLPELCTLPRSREERAAQRMSRA